MQTKTVLQVRNRSKLKGSAYMVLNCIAEHANDNGYAFPGRALLAKAAHLSERSVERHVKTLSKRGEVYMRVGRGRGNYTTYLITCGLTKEQIKARLIEHFGFTEWRADKAANGIFKRFSSPIPKQTRQKKATELTIEKATNPTPFSDEEKATLLAEKATELTVKGDRISVKGDTFTNPPIPPYKEVLEPLTISEPREPVGTSVPNESASLSSAPGTPLALPAPENPEPPSSDWMFKKFQEGHKAHYGIPFSRPSRKGKGNDFSVDFVMMANLKTGLCDLGECLTGDQWEQACANYFATPQGSHTPAKLCEEFSLYQATRLDRFAKPVAQSSRAPDAAVAHLSEIGQRNAAVTQNWLERKFPNG